MQRNEIVVGQQANGLDSRAAFIRAIQANNVGVAAQCLFRMIMSDPVPESDGDKASVYSVLVSALNDAALKTTWDNNKKLRADIRQCLTDVLKKKVESVLKSDNLKQLKNVQEGLTLIIDQVQLLQGSGGWFGMAAEKHAKLDLEQLQGQLSEAIKRSEDRRFEALFRAVSFGMHDRVSALIKEVNEHELDINRQDGGGRTLLSTAAFHGDKKIAELLLESKVDVNHGDAQRGQKPLLIAAQENHPGLVKLFLDHGAAVNQARGLDGATPLWIAAKFGREKIVKQLLKGGATVDQARTDGGSTPLIAAAEEGHAAIARELLDHGAAVNQARTDGATPLQLAANGLHLAVVQCLVEKKADLCCRYKGKFSPLDLAIYQSGNKPYNNDVVLFLLRTMLKNRDNLAAEAMLSIDSLETKSMTLLLLVALRNDELRPVDQVSVQQALNEAKSDDDTTPLFAAVEKGDAPMVKKLLKQGAEVDEVREKDGVTPLQAAACLGHLAIVQCLVKNKADINRPAPSGRVPLSMAIYHRGKSDGLSASTKGKDEVARFLLYKMIQGAARLGDEPIQAIDLPANQTIYSSVIAALNHDTLKPIYEGDKIFRTRVRAWLANALKDKTMALMQKSDVQGLKAEIEGMRAILAEVALLKSKGLMGHEKQAVKDIKKLMVMLQMMLPSKMTEVDTAIAHPRTDVFEDGAPPGEVSVTPSLIEKDDALLAAAREGDLSLVKQLIESQANVYHQDDNGFTPLGLAIQGGNLSVVECLLFNMVKLASPPQQATKSSEKSIYTALIAALNHEPLYTTYFLNNKALRGHIRSLLVKAFTDKTQRLVKENQAHPLRAEYLGLQAVREQMTLFKGGNALGAEKRSVIEIRQCQGELNGTYMQGQRSLLQAVSADNIPEVQAWLARGFDVDCAKSACGLLNDYPNEGGRTPLLEAIRKNNLNMVKVLLEAGANPNLPNSMNDRPPIYEALCYASKAIRDLLIEKGALLTQVSATGVTLLMMAVYDQARDEVVDYLLNQGVDVNAQARSGETALYFAAQNKDQPMVEKLLKHGARVHYLIKVKAAGERRAHLEMAMNRAGNEIIQIWKSALNQEMRFYLLDAAGNRLPAPKCYTDLIVFINKYYAHDEVSVQTQQTMRLCLTTAVHERVSWIVNYGNEEVRRQEVHGLSDMMTQLNLIQVKEDVSQQAMQALTDWKAALEAKIADPKSKPTLCRPSAERVSSAWSVMGLFRSSDHSTANSLPSPGQPKSVEGLFERL